MTARNHFEDRNRIHSESCCLDLGRNFCEAITGRIEYILVATHERWWWCGGGGDGGGGGGGDGGGGGGGAGDGVLNLC